MGWTHVDSNKNWQTNAGGNNLTVTKPTGLAVDDLLVMSAWQLDMAPVPEPNPTTDWVEVISGYYSSNPYWSLSIWYKIADADDVAASSFTNTGAAGESRFISLAAYRPTGVVVLGDYGGPRYNGTTSPETSTIDVEDGQLVHAFVGMIVESGSPTVDGSTYTRAAAQNGVSTLYAGSANAYWLDADAGTTEVGFGGVQIAVPRSYMGIVAFGIESAGGGGFGGFGL